MPRNPKARTRIRIHSRRRHNFSITERAVMGVADAISTKLRDAKDLPALRRMLPKIAEDQKFWDAVKALQLAAKTLEGIDLETFS